MNTPDKIYIDPNVQIGWFRGERPSKLFREYIRKDLLLEWLKAKVYEHNEDKFDDGFNTALGQVIDKINSL